MKICSKCKKELPESNFNKRGKKLQPFCKKCNSKYLKEHYKNNKDYYKRKRKRNNNKYKEWFRKYKKELKCIVCGENHVATLDFHHRDSTEKDFTVSAMAGMGFSPKSILKEIEKCDVLCSNCHRKLHSEEKNGAIV